MSFLKIQNLSVDYKMRRETVYAAKNVNIEVSKGEILGLVGESGSGKSTVGNAIIDLIDEPGKVSNGSIILGDINIHGNLKNISNFRGKKIGLIFQDPQTSLNPILTIGDQLIETIQTHLDLNKDDAKLKSIELLKEVGIKDAEMRFNNYPHQFSGGMRQRIMIAMSLQCNPALLIADEPTTALDVTIQAQILDLMMDLKDKRKDAAILLITHDLAVIAETCDRVIVMYGGVIQEIAPIDKLFKNPIHPYTKALMDSIPKMDIKAKRLKALKGMVPSILELDDGCKLCSRFDPDECACKGTKVEPDLVEVSKGHFARVHQDLVK